jgi:hypothetical protein
VRITTAWKIALLFISGILYTQFIAAQARIYIDQPQYSLFYYGQATLSVKIEGLTPEQSLRGYQIHLNIDSTYLSVSGLSAFTEGSFLSGVGVTQWYVIEENGGYTATCAILDHTPGATGSGTLFTVNICAKAQPTGPPGTDVTLSNIILRDPLNHVISYLDPGLCNIVIHEGVRIYIVEPHYDLLYFDEVTLAVKIEGLTSGQALRGYQIHLDFDDLYLEVSGLSAFVEGEFLSNVGLTQCYVIEEYGGYTFTCSILDHTPGAYGSGTLFYVTLKAKTRSTGSAGTDVLLSNVILRDPLNHNIYDYTLEHSNIVIDPLPIYTGIKVFLQGSYAAGGTMRHELADHNYIPLVSPYNAGHTVTAFPNVAPRYIVDWIYVQLRASLTGAFEQAKSCFLLNDGTIVDQTGNPVLEFEYTTGYSYYLTIKHRNHLAVMSASRQAFTVNPSSATIADLTVLNSVYGGNYLGVKQIETGVLALYSGDADQSGVISPTDANLYWRLQTGFLYGYYSADFGLDGNVQPSDLNLYWRPNSGKISQIP